MTQAMYEKMRRLENTAEELDSSIELAERGRRTWAEVIERLDALEVAVRRIRTLSLGRQRAAMRRDRRAGL